MNDFKQALGLAIILLSGAALIYSLCWPHAVYVRSCNCGAHWYIRRWFFFWRHLDASPFNDKLQNRWNLWMFEFRRVLKITAKEQAEMGYPEGPWWPSTDGLVLSLRGKPMWANSAWLLSPSPRFYCARCARRSW